MAYTFCRKLYAKIEEEVHLPIDVTIFNRTYLTLCICTVYALITYYHPIVHIVMLHWLYCNAALPLLLWCVYRFRIFCESIWWNKERRSIYDVMAGRS